MKTSTLILVAIILFPFLGRAQQISWDRETEDSPATREEETCEDKSCFRAQACPRCQNVFLLEFMIAGSSEHCGEGGWFGGEIGFLRNLGPHYGVGGKFFIGGDDCGERQGIRVVGRRWLSPQVSFEVGPGIVLGGPKNQSFPSFSFQMALEFAGIVAPMFQLELIRSEQPDISNRWESSFGVRTSSWGVPAGLILMIVGVAAWGCEPPGLRDFPSCNLS